MDSVENAQKIWAEMKFSRVMDVDDEWMRHLFRKEGTVKEVLSELWNKLADGGVDVPATAHIFTPASANAVHAPI